MASDTPDDLKIAIAALVVCVIAAGAAVLFVTQGGDDDGTPSAGQAEVAPAVDSGAQADDPAPTGGEAAESGQPAPGLAQIDPGDIGDEQSCRFRVRSATLRPDPETARGWQEIGLQMRPISPAQGTPTGVDFKVVSSARIDCDLHSGVLGTRGGMSFALGNRSLDLRRTRLDFGNGLMRMFPASTGFDGIDASGLTLGESTVAQNGNEVTVIVPLRATPDVAGQMNLALGQEVFSGDATVGTFHLVGERRILGEQS